MSIGAGKSRVTTSDSRLAVRICVCIEEIYPFPVSWLCKFKNVNSSEMGFEGENDSIIGGTT